jgi:drug/metabolite transporter (DMT)-like permease
MTAPDSAAAPRQNLWRAAAWMAGWLLALATMAIAGRELSHEVSTFQTMFFRSVISLALTAVLWMSLGRPRLTTHRFWAHASRNVVHYGAQFCWFVAIALLPLAQVISIEFTAPAWTALFAAMFLRERLTVTRVLAIVLGIVGVIVILRPGLEAISIGTLIALVAAIGFGVVLSLTKTLSRTEPTLTILFHMHVMQLVIGTGPAMWYWVPPTAAVVPWAVAVGVAGFASHYCLSKAMTHADATVVTPLDFLRLPIMIVVGYLLYQESLDMFVFFGASLILTGNFINMHKESRKAQS